MNLRFSLKMYMNNTIEDCHIIDIRKFSDNRGYLSVIEGGLDIPFEIKRVYYLYLVPEAARGAHAHKQLQQLMIATSGSVHVTLDDGKTTKTFVLDKPWKGLFVAPGLWRSLALSRARGWATWWSLPMTSVCMSMVR